MFDLGWTELLVIGIVALIVIGPKDLPVLFRNVGRWVGRIRGMARDFSQAMNDAADEAGVKDVQNTLRAATNPVGTAMDGVKKATQDLTKGLDVGSLDPTKYDPDSETGKLAAQRAEQSAKIKAASARKAAEKLQEQADAAMAKAAEAEAALTPPQPEAPTPPDETKT